MKLIVGLGNPEKKYAGTRHNVGFAMLDAYTTEQGITWKDTPKFKATIATLDRTGSHPVLFVKPATYYNLSGEAVRAVADFYKIAPEDILVIHDDHALPFGILRTRQGCSDAGNNGIKSINAHLPGTNRLRVGTHVELRDRTDNADFVLSKFTASEKKTLALLQNYTNKILDDFAVGEFIATTYQ